MVFGATYRESAFPLAILLMGLITLSSSAQNHLLQIATDAKFNRNTSLAGLVILYMVATITVPWLGTEGAAIARVVTMWALFFMSLVFVRRSWGGNALSGRNTLVAITSVSVPVMIFAVDESPLVNRILISLPCLALLVFLLRGQDGHLVVKDVVNIVWSRFSR